MRTHAPVQRMRTDVDGIPIVSRHTRVIASMHVSRVGHVTCRTTCVIETTNDSTESANRTVPVVALKLHVPDST